MKKRLSSLFDYQKFQGNERLSAMIRDTEARYMFRELEDDELELVNAAGEIQRLSGEIYRNKPDNPSDKLSDPFKTVF